MLIQKMVHNTRKVNHNLCKNGNDMYDTLWRNTTYIAWHYFVEKPHSKPAEIYGGGDLLARN